MVVFLLAVVAVVFALDLDRDVLHPEAVVDERTQFVDDLLRTMDGGLTVHDDVGRRTVASRAEGSNVHVVRDVDVSMRGQHRRHVGR